MKGIVVYQSWWGSCRRIAETIGEALVESGHTVIVVSVDEKVSPDPSLDFLVIGAATRWPGARPKIKRCAKSLLQAGLSGKPFSAFSTGGEVFDEKPNTQASEQLYEILEKGGMLPLAPPLRIGIEGYKAPGIVRGTLPESEVERARGYALEIGRKLAGDG